MSDDIRAEIDAISQALVQVVTSLTGPASDAIRSTTNATVDALIDGRSRMVLAGWSNELADAVVLSIINRNADVTKQIAESIRIANQNRNSGKSG